MSIIEIIIIAAIATAIRYAIKKSKRNKLRAARGGAYVPDDSRWATNEFQYGRHQEYPIVGNDPDKYFGALVNEGGKHITWHALTEYNQISENFDFEELVITPYLISVDGKPDGKMFFHRCDVPNTKNTPKGYKFIEEADKKRSNAEKGSIKMKFCPYCGFELKIDAKFCPKCGKKLGD